MLNNLSMYRFHSRNSSYTKLKLKARYVDNLELPGHEFLKEIAGGFFWCFSWCFSENRHLYNSVTNTKTIYMEK